MAGYKDWSMSNNAVDAYSDGEMPLSKWTKSEMLAAFEAVRDDIDFSKLTVSELRLFLRRSSWHHTSKHFNKTDFYCVDEERLEEITQANIDIIIGNRAPRQKKTADEKEADNRAKLIAKFERTAKKAKLNPYFTSSDCMVSKASIQELEKDIERIEQIIESYSMNSGKYKTLGGYAKAEWKKRG